MASESSPTVKKPRSISRMGLGTMAVLQVLLAFTCLVLLNYLSCTQHKRIDLTQQKEFTLSEKSLNLLKSKTVAQRTSPVKIIAAVKQQSPYYLKFRSLLEEYARHAEGKIELEFVDPIRDPSRTQELATTYQRRFHEEVVLIDARAAAVDSETTPQEAQAQLSTYVRQIPVRSMFVTNFDEEHRQYIAAWRAEEYLSSYLLSAIEGNPRRFYFIVDKSKVDSDSSGSPAWKTFSSLLLQQNIRLIPLQISAIDSIPADAEGVALIGPSYDFIPREIEILEEYWGRNSASLYITLDPDARLTQLNRFLREYGITPQNNRVLTTKNNRTYTAASGYFVDEQKINQGLAHKATQLDGSTCGLEVRTEDDSLRVRNITPFTLLQATQGWWGESRYTHPNPTFNPKEDQGSLPGAVRETPVPMAAAVVRGLENTEQAQELNARMIVIANTSFLNGDNMRQELTDFVNNSVQWLAGREDLIGIGPKAVRRQKITVQAEHKSLLDLIVLVILPLIALVVALVLWNTRRS